jgi:NAD-dependent dihydropyrimidine dehydrogenase PreA subunit
VRRIDDHASGYLIDPWAFLGPKRRKMLDESWAGEFRRHIFPHLPVGKLGERFNAGMGRPTKELYQMLGAPILQQLRDLTDEEAQWAMCFDIGWQYALDVTDISDQASYICQRTIWEYRQILVEMGLDEAIFAQCTDALIQAFGVGTDKQRMDSTHIRSNMRKLGRLRIFGETIRGFLRELKRVAPDRHAGLDQAMRARYEGEQGGCFGQVRPSEAGPVLDQAVQDLAMLVERFRADRAVAELASYKLLERVIEEQCTVTRDKDDAPPQTKLKTPKDVPSDSLQNPSDPDAGYSGHKGQGYTAQIMETYTTAEEDATILSLITHVAVTPAHVGDSGALVPALQQTAGRGCGAQDVTADSAYGSDDNHQVVTALGVALVAPTAGGDDARNGSLGIKDFTCDEATLTIKACPRGQAALQTETTRTERKVTVFDRDTCAACPDRERCPVKVTATRACIYYEDPQIRLALRRQYEATDAFRDRYRWRAGIEGTNSRLKSQTGAGRLRVRGLARVRFAIRLKALGLNILRATRAYAARMRRLEELAAILRPIWSFFHPIRSIRIGLDQFSLIIGENRPLTWNVAA